MKKIIVEKITRFFSKSEIFCKIRPHTSHIQNTVIDFAPNNKSIMSNKITSTILERILRRTKYLLTR